MELAKIREQNDEELVQTQNTAAEQLFRLRFQKSLGNQEGVKKLRVLKLDIARARTVARERALAAEQQAKPAVKSSAPAASKRTERHQQKRQAAQASAQKGKA